MYNLTVYPYLDSFQVRFYSVGIQEQKHIEEIEQEFVENDNNINKSVPDQEQTKTIICEQCTKEDITHSKIVSANRCKNNIYNYIRSNKFEYFFTLTFDRELIDSSNWDEVTKAFSTWANNMKKRYYPDMKYVFVPELHSDKKHYHLHGCVSGIDKRFLIDSGHKKNGCIIYNFTKWIYGFSTVSRIKDISKTSTYIGKYISKDLLEHLRGKKRYFVSRNCTLTEPLKINIDSNDFTEFMIKYLPDYQKTIEHNEMKVSYLEYNISDMQEQYYEIMTYLKQLDLTK